MVISKPSASFRARIDRPMLLPAEFSGTASTPSAELTFLRVTLPLTGSITVGSVPQPDRDFLPSFQTIPLFAERADATRRRLGESAIGSSLRDVTIIEQNSFSAVTETFLNAFLLSLTNPISACDFSVSTVTSPLPRSERYHDSSPVSETIGLSIPAFGYFPGWSEKEVIRVACRSAVEVANPGVKYGRSDKG